MLKSPEYVQPSAAFVRAAEDLVEAAKHRDIDAAALDYVSLALKCFECHRYVNVKNSRIATRQRMRLLSSPARPTISIGLGQRGLDAQLGTLRENEPPGNREWRDQRNARLASHSLKMPKTPPSTMPGAPSLPSSRAQLRLRGLEKMRRRQGERRQS